MKNHELQMAINQTQIEMAAWMVFSFTLIILIMVTIATMHIASFVRLYRKGKCTGNELSQQIWTWGICFLLMLPVALPLMMVSIERLNS